ncbi:hypothetical protein IFR05_011539 [Cadophora sp. M221]|nr:hypothetical protein IFR05_011539 [Cadophora sp. M221]
MAWVRKESPYSCLRIRLDKSNLWLRILANSETCATFACITLLCFECGKYKCRGSDLAPWENKIYALETAICLSLCDYELANPAKTLLEWASRPKASYWIGKCGSSLTATVVSMGKERIRCCWGRLREKQASDEIAIKVIIVTEKGKSP